MTFNDDSRIGSDNVRRRSRGRTAGIATGGGVLGLVAVFLISQFLGVDVSGLVGGGTDTGGGGTAQDTELSECTTGADANTNVDCRMVGAYNSLDSFWSGEAPQIGVTYSQPDLVIFDQGTSTGCGDATSATGPFYCPTDTTIYLDPSFFDELTSRFGADAGPLAQLYVVAHEYGHHIQQIGGFFANTDRSGTGPASDSVRLELQADCFAGAWVAGAESTTDENGQPLIEPVTDDQIAQALSAASAVGDDRIQQSSGGGVDPESWTHGSSEQRQRWFSTGRAGGAGECDTFAPADSSL